MYCAELGRQWANLRHIRALGTHASLQTEVRSAAQANKLMDSKAAASGSTELRMQYSSICAIKKAKEAVIFSELFPQAQTLSIVPDGARMDRYDFLCSFLSLPFPGCAKSFGLSLPPQVRTCAAFGNSTFCYSMQAQMRSAHRLMEIAPLRPMTF